MLSETELIQRVRRIETRLTQTMVALGIDTQAQKPTFDSRRNRLILPSAHSSFKEAVAAIPPGMSAPVHVYVGSDRVGTLVLGDR